MKAAIFNLEHTVCSRDFKGRMELMSCLIHRAVLAALHNRPGAPNGYNQRTIELEALRSELADSNWRSVDAYIS